MALAGGTRLGPYQLVSLVGSGGMGEVYRARDQKLDRDVAIKILPEAFAIDAERIARFEREAKTLAALNHPRIAQIYGFEEAGGIRALVMELVEGPTLADRLAQGPLPRAEALAIARQIAEALEAAHDQGIVHRDLKPANIAFTRNDEVKVLDFGLAKALDQSDSQAPGAGLSHSPTLSLGATRVGMILGTAAYMAPEQARGKPVDKRADIWAFGCIVFEMLTGRRAFEGDDVSETLARVIEREPDWARLPADVPPVLSGFLRRCLEKDSKKRIRDIGDVKLALEGVFETIAATPSAVTSPPRSTWTHRVPYAAAVLSLGVAAGVFIWRAPRSEPRAVTRFEHLLPTAQTFRSINRAVIAVSPDGRRFVYNTNQGLYLRSLDDAQARLLPGTAANLQTPFFSPDGQSVGYFQEGQLKRLALTGGAPVNIAPATNLFGATWTVDDFILFGQPEGIMRVPASGGAPELIVRAGEGEVLDAPQLLPDGDSLLFSLAQRARTTMEGSRWDAAQVVVQSLKSGARKTLIQGGSDARYVPSGHLVYALNDGLFAVGFDADALGVIGGRASVAQGLRRSSFTSNGAATANYEVGRDGTLVYVAGDVSSSELVSLSWVTRDGQSQPLAIIPPNQFLSPRFSADEQRLVVHVAGDVHVYELASGRVSRVTTDGAAGPYVDWVPGDRAVVYSSVRTGRGGPMNVWMQAPDATAAATQVTALNGEVHVDSWAPDGKTLAVHHHRPDGAGSDLLMVPFAGAAAEPQSFFPGPGRSDAVFSPDGRYIAYVSQGEIHIRPFPGPGAQIPVSVGGGTEPAWARNGELFYRRPKDYMMIAVPVATKPALAVGRPTELFRGPFAPIGSPRARYAVTADGKRFLMSSRLLASSQQEPGESQLKIHVVVNWVEELKRLVPAK